jgi:hypothetical protein
VNLHDDEIETEVNLRGGAIPSRFARRNYVQRAVAGIDRIHGDRAATWRSPSRTLGCRRGAVGWWIERSQHAGGLIHILPRFAIDRGS